MAPKKNDSSVSGEMESPNSSILGAREKVLSPSYIPGIKQIEYSLQPREVGFFCPQFKDKTQSKWIRD